MRTFKPLVALGLVGGGALLWAGLGPLSGKAAPPPPRVLDTAGSETQLDGAVLINGWNVADIGDAQILTAYQRWQGLLGEPTSAFDGRSQAFRNGTVTYNPNNPPGWRVELANSGRVEMEIEGYTPKPGSTPHPAVRDWLISQQDIGVDLTRVVGQILSDPICDRAAQCRQFTDKQLFLFPRSATAADAVQRAPVGLWLTHTWVRQEALAAAPGQDQDGALRLSPAALTGIVLGLVSVAALVGFALLGKAGRPSPFV